MDTQYAPLSDNELNTPEGAKKFLFITKIIHFALVMGLVMFGGVAVLVSAKQMSFTPDFSNPVIWVAVLGCIITIGLSFLMFPIYRKASPAPASPSTALRQYQVMCLMRWAVIEGGALFSAVVFIISKNILPLGLLAASVVYLISRYPSQKEFIEVTEKR